MEPMALATEDCSFSLHYPSLRCRERICRYSYCSWCPTCEKSSPRRRSKSETNEPCRRKCREMKGLNGHRRYTRSHEYENMDLEFGVCEMKDAKDRFDCCRVRSNLCELPTSYISNNCQANSAVSNLSKMSTDRADFIDCLEKSVKNYEQTVKLLGYNSPYQPLGTNMDKSKTLKYDDKYIKYPINKFDDVNGFNKSPVCKDLKSAGKNQTTPPKNSLQAPKCYLDTGPCEIRMQSFKTNLAQNSVTTNLTERNKKPNGYINLLERYDNNYTSTYFDKHKEPNNLKTLYSKEVELLKEKLKDLKKQNYSIPVKNKSPPPVVPQIKSAPPLIFNGKLHTVDYKMVTPLMRDENSCNTTKVIEIRKMIQPFASVPIRSKVSLKTKKKLGPARIRKMKSKIGTKTDLGKNQAVESDYSDSDESVQGAAPDEEEVIEQGGSSSGSSGNTRESTPVTNFAGAGDASSRFPVRYSMFPFIPPYISFSYHDADKPVTMPGGRKLFKWKLSTITPILVRKTLSNTGFVMVRKSNQWLGTWGKHLKSPVFQTLKEFQKLNHFPGTFQLGRKDRLWRNFQKLINKFGYREFGFLPQTFVLPAEIRLLKQCWDFKKTGEMWILKPPASARGVGIRVINKWSQLPKKQSLVVQRYISNPYLINGSKFDLRLYVLVTSFNPLRVYLYPEGLVRFASVKYSSDPKDLKDKFMHLTNYSINKMSSLYTANEDANACQGHKWTISKLWEYMERQGINTRMLWKNLQQLVVKTMITAEPPIMELCEENLGSRYNCYELFGVDVLLDEHLKPWLLEVNISPSLHSSSPLDAVVKGPLVKTLFDLAQFHFPQKLYRYYRPAPKTYDPKIYSVNLTKKEDLKHRQFEQHMMRTEYLEDILEDLTGDDVRHLTQAEDEFVAKGMFERVFPTAMSYRYFEFMEVRYYNRLFDAWEFKYEKNRQAGIERLQHLCAQKLHLKVAPNPVNRNVLSSTPSESQNLQSSIEGQSLLQSALQVVTINDKS